MIFDRVTVSSSSARSKNAVVLLGVFPLARAWISTVGKDTRDIKTREYCETISFLVYLYIYIHIHVCIFSFHTHLDDG